MQSVNRAIDILLAFNAAHPELSLSELADTVGLPLSSTHRLARTLVERGLLRQDDWGTYALGTRLLELGGLVSNSSPLIGLTADTVRAVADSTGETILVAGVNWIDNSVVIMRRVDSVHPLSVASPVGKRSALASGCIGKAVLSGLDVEESDALIPRIHLVRRTPDTVIDLDTLNRQVAQARRRGWATDNNEYIPDVSGVAVPVSAGGRPLGAVAVIVPTARGAKTRLAEIGAMLTDLAATITPSADNHSHGRRRKSL
ncbi:IclR family transcriptional regulator [Nocardia noduli]|uniref:IclR family transcriptional regulator n=1 Tax=Nocardia noduli TaxID=2815722 RepID=UPI001C22C2E7|nr:IclR family transcriptional regulator [Nocardia noduli]